MAGPSIALSMIVRNEAATLGRCLAGMRDAVDELVVVDTGSTDETIEIARSFDARVSRFDWVDDFAKARQFAFDQARADWILWLDADDVVEGADRIRPAVDAASSAAAGFNWQYVTARDRGGRPTCTFWRERCVRREGGFRWQGAVHEVLTGPAASRLVRDGNVRVEHLPDPARRRDPRRNLAILQAEHARLGGRTTPRTLLYLGLEYMALGELAEAEPFLERFLRVSSWSEQGYYAFLALADLRRRQGRFSAAARAAHAARDLVPSRPEAYFSLAETAYFRKDWPQVVRWAEAGMALPTVDADWLTHPMDAAYRWIIHYTNALYHLGRVAEALAWTRRALAIQPEDRWHLANRTFFEAHLAGMAAKA
jgi:glycosyltransferase involved in cell wall biosynthesis